MLFLPLCVCMHLFTVKLWVRQLRAGKTPQCMSERATIRCSEWWKQSLEPVSLLWQTAESVAEQCHPMTAHHVLTLTPMGWQGNRRTTTTQHCEIRSEWIHKLCFTYSWLVSHNALIKRQLGRNDTFTLGKKVKENAWKTPVSKCKNRYRW